MTRDGPAVERGDGAVAGHAEGALDHLVGVVDHRARLAARNQGAFGGVGAVGERLADDGELGPLRGLVQPGAGQAEDRQAAAGGADAVDDGAGLLLVVDTAVVERAVGFDVADAGPAARAKTSNAPIW